MIKVKLSGCKFLEPSHSKWLSSLIKHFMKWINYDDLIQGPRGVQGPPGLTGKAGKRVWSALTVHFVYSEIVSYFILLCAGRSPFCWVMFLAFSGSTRGWWRKRDARRAWGKGQELICLCIHILMSVHPSDFVFLNKVSWYERICHVQITLQD